MTQNKKDVNLEVEKKENFEDVFCDDVSDVSDLIRNAVMKEEYTQELNNIFENLSNDNNIEFNTSDEIENSVQPFDEVQEELKTHSKVRDVFIDNAITDRKLKRKYGTYLLWMLFVQLFIVNLIFFLGGIEFLKYSDITFNIFITGSLVEIAVIVRIAAKYLFTDNISKTFNNMIDHNHNAHHSKHK